MKWEEFLAIAGKLPVIESENLLAGNIRPESVIVQLSRWTKQGKLLQIKRGVYVVAPPFRTQQINEAYLAGVLKHPSYISLEKALEYHNLIPEMVTAYTCVTTKRPGRFVSPAGTFEYRHIKQSLFWGYEAITVDGQTAFYATPEKALLDLFYLKQVPASPAYLEELRLQNVEAVNIATLRLCTERFGKPGMLRIGKLLSQHLHHLAGEETPL